MYISEKAPAKINLTLDVLYKRDDGYHELEMVMTTIDLADRIDLIDLPYNEIRLESSSGLVPQDERNLAYLAAKRLKEKMRIDRGVSIYISKQIPVAAGLAGGSSDAAATLRGLNKLWKLGLSLEELADIGAEIGSDVPFCVYSHTAIAKGRGEILIPLPPPPPCWVVLAKPVHGVSTADIFGQLRVDEIRVHPSTEAMAAAIRSNDFEAICNHLGNVLEPVTMSMYPEVRKIKDKMIQFGADAVLMSGSGPTVFALVKQESRAQRLVNSLKGFCQHVFLVRMLGILDQRRTK
ncbi:4-(cytidine 5'-diphospho)-2-C-methyl-D-erythritol kinase [Thermoflavimicrobium dichotomicum]|uniref:4-diphosphocytidyl-2-C-methyl-D-erythritol kinase n=1 Tax=Thermoflavimicrobium dichotomicum TaxID=46223 RepID=A0A1I3QQ86_9BACL|nr:4-(cytidine 5'-diphospho)-2-C-methyl-D-erythritol kinase [Thermoflavimicrobium dichotomicum]SFJ35326.1 4-diphosphocytidyl-2-C-methyl-D-erythritol kinase [Thermoflavimicrobium dichotomicum]